MQVFASVSAIREVFLSQTAGDRCLVYNAMRDFILNYRKTAHERALAAQNVYRVVNGLSGGRFGRTTGGIDSTTPTNSSTVLWTK